jgi:hypothetical protein
MGYKPADFFIGIIDFFGVLVPGAVLLFLQRPYFRKLVDLQPCQNPAIEWVAFLVGSFVLGQLVFGIGIKLNELLPFYEPEAKDNFYKEVKDKIHLPAGEQSRESAFYQAFSFIRINSAAALAEVERQSAEYKLFRSLTVVFILDTLLALFSCCHDWSKWAFPLVLSAVALYRFLFLLSWTYRITFEFYELLTRTPKASAESGC